MYTGKQEYKYRLYKRHQIEFYLAFLQFNIESSYRWDPQCFPAIDPSQQSECFQTKFKNIPMELKCTKLKEEEYWRKCLVGKARCVQCHYSKDINTGEENVATNGDGIRSKDCFDLSGDKDSELISDCPHWGINFDGRGFCYNELALESKSGLLAKKILPPQKSKSNIFYASDWNAIFWLLIKF